MSLASAWLDELTAEDLDHLAELLAPRLAVREVDDSWLRGAKQIGSYIAASVNRVYKLSSAGEIPVEHDGSTLIARKSVLDAWLRDGGGKCL
jgi:hypothetical protein